MHYRRRAIGREGEVRESFARKTRDQVEELKFPKMRRRGSDREMGRWSNDCAKNTQLPFRRQR